MLLCRICVRSLEPLSVWKKVNIALNEIQNSHRLLKSIHLSKLYEIAGIAPPNIKRDVGAKEKRQKTSYDERHSLYRHTGIVKSVLKFRRTFLRQWRNSKFQITIERQEIWRADNN